MTPYEGGSLKLEPLEPMGPIVVVVVGGGVGVGVVVGVVVVVEFFLSK